MISFSYTPCFDDYIAFEKFKFKRNRTFFITYVMCIMFLVLSIYYAVSYKSYEILIGSAAMVAAVCASTYYTMKIEPKKRIKNFISIDSNYLTQNEVIIDSKFIEIKNIPQENQVGAVTVYPYSVMSVIYETEDYYYFFIGVEVKILPKKAIPVEYADSVKKIISSNKNYAYIK